MPFIDLNGLSRFLEKIKRLIDEKVANVSAPTPWRYRYDSAGDVLGLERDVDSYTATKTILPYRITADVELTDKANAFNNTENTEYATMLTSTEARKAKIYIDTELPMDATLSAFSVSFKIGTSNISAAMWSARRYVVKCGGNTLGSGDFALRTTGNITTITVSDTSLIVSPIIEIEITAQTTAEQSVRIFGAMVDATYTATQEWISVVHQNQLAWRE